MIAHTKRSIVLLSVAALLLALPLPALAQAPGDFSYRMEGLGLIEMGATDLMYVVTPNQSGIQLGEGNSLALQGTLQCMADDPACVSGGLDGQPLALSISRIRGSGSTALGLTLENVMISSYSITFEDVVISSLTAGSRDLGPIQMSGFGSLTCADGPCQTLNLQIMACSAAGNRQFGLVLNGLLQAWPGSGTPLTAGNYPLKLQSLSGTGYLTRPDMPNPVCGGRDLSAAFAEEVDPLSPDLPGRGADVSALELPGVAGGRVDRTIVIDSATGDLGSSSMQVGVKGYFFGQCGVEAQARVWDDTDSVHVLIYRVIPDGTICKGGVEPFSLLLPTIEQDNLVKGGDRMRLNINDQVVGVHDIPMNQGNTTG